MLQSNHNHYFYTTLPCAPCFSGGGCTLLKQFDMLEHVERGEGGETHVSDVEHLVSSLGEEQRRAPD